MPNALEPLPRERGISTKQTGYTPSVSVFFFQAEDGIRDLVTGVQTCALPISSDRRPQSGAQPCHLGLGIIELTIEISPREGGGDQQHRSDERRVGKECRSRW